MRLKFEDVEPFGTVSFFLDVNSIPPFQGYSFRAVKDCGPFCHEPLSLQSGEFRAKGSDQM